MLAKQIGQGCECVVLKHGANKVLKIYRTQANAQYAINNQRKAHAAGIAPRMFSDGPFDYSYEYDDGMFKYAIISEYVRPAVREDFDNYDDYFDQPISEAYENLVVAFEHLFGGINDLHISNLGWTTDRRLVAIDFGALSISRGEDV